MSAIIARFSINEYHQFIVAGVFSQRHVELLDGLIVEITPEGSHHSHAIRESSDWFREHLLGKAKVSESHPITLQNSEPEPDIALVVGQSYRDRHPSAEETYLVIEVAFSSLDKDLNDKAKIYAQASISEYWLIDLKNEQVIVMQQPGSSGYQKTETVKIGKLHPLHFPELEVPVGLLLGQDEYL